MKRLYIITPGFTLVELLVSVVVLGILASLGASGFQSLIQSQRSKNASFEIFSSLSLARSEAIKRNNFVTVTPADSTNWGKGWAITYIDAITSNTKTIKSQSELKKIVIPQGPASVVYAPTGRATVSIPFLLDVSTTLTENARCIKIELSGMPRVEKPVNGACV
ncbi:MAG: type IV fimbrial biogenesis protein FimT [Candidatus Nitrotoga sp. LAW]|nr:MAG: type IV fimbrial biogenesis protein FimT [Candidatus Nitrotoga sp. LAW]